MQANKKCFAREFLRIWAFIILGAIYCAELAYLGYETVGFARHLPQEPPDVLIFAVISTIWLAGGIFLYEGLFQESLVGALIETGVVLFRLFTVAMITTAMFTVVVGLIIGFAHLLMLPYALPVMGSIIALGLLSYTVIVACDRCQQ